jgi:hypothetical protein
VASVEQELLAHCAARRPGPALPTGEPWQAAQRMQSSAVFQPLLPSMSGSKVLRSNFYGLFCRLPIGGVQLMPYISLADGVGTTNNQPFNGTGNHGKDR